MDGGTALLWSAVVGAALSAFYDLFRLARLAVPHPVWMVFLEDLLFCGISAVAVFLFLLEVRNGQIRFFLLAGIGAGFFLWHETLGLLLVSGADLLFAFCRLCVYGICFLLLKPPALLIGMIMKRVKKWTLYRKKVKNEEKKEENPLEKNGGDGV